MRKPTMTFLAASVALALGASAWAAPGAVRGGATTSTAMTNAAAGTIGAGAVTAAPSSSTGTTTSTGNTSTSTTSSTGTTSLAGTTTGNGIARTSADYSNVNTDPFGSNSTFSNDNGNPLLGTSPGQTSSGTAAASSSQGIGSGTESLGTTNNSSVNPNDLGGAFIGPSEVAGGVVTLPAPAPMVPAPTYSSDVSATTSTPLLNAVTAQEIRKEQRQRSSGSEPRVIGIAPRTNADRTDQMPDDPIIRY